MRKFLGRVLGYDREIAELVAQRDTNRALVVQQARHAEDLKVQLDAALSDQAQAAMMVREAHRQMNLRHSGRHAQRKVLEAARLLEGETR